MVFERSQSPLASSEPITIPSTTDWGAIDIEFSAILSPVHYRLSSDEISTSEAADIFSSLFKAHLERYDTTQEPATTSAFIHRTRRIEKTVGRLRKLKNSNRRNMRQNPSEFHNISRAYNKALKALNRNVVAQNLRKHEKAFKSNPWSYSKKLCSSSTSTTSPACTSSEAYSYFSDITEESSRYQSLPSWINEVWPAPDLEEFTPFDLSPITPGLVKGVLKKRSSNSSPGDDGSSSEEDSFIPSFSSYPVFQDSAEVPLCPTSLKQNQDQASLQRR